MIQLLSEKKVLKNEKQWPRTYTRKFIEQGLVDYKDANLAKGLKVLLLRKETIDQMIPGFIDKPVVIKHQDVDTDNFTDLSVGYIKSITFNPIDGWYYVDFLITHDEGHEKMEDGWGVSCAYKVNQIISGGKYHNIEYDGEIVAGVGEHLALVQNPRYEDCLTVVKGVEEFLYNEKSYLTKNQREDNKMLFNFFGKKEDKGFAPETMVDLGNGKTAKLADIMKIANSILSKEAHQIDGAEEIELANGKKVKLEDAIKAFNAATDKGETEDEKKAREVEEGKKAENAVKFKNCACGGEKDGKHMDSCKMYNSDGSEKKDGKEKEGEDMKNAVTALQNEIKELKLKNEALEAAVKNGDTFIKLNAAKNLQTGEVVLENSTKESGTIDSKLENSKKHFVKKA